MPKKALHPALQANVDKLKRGEPLYDGKSKEKPQRPKIRTKASSKKAA